MTTSLSHSFRKLLLYCLLGVVGWMFGQTTAAAQAGCEVTFAFTGGLQSWTVPPGVTSIRIEAAGAKGGNETVCSFCAQGGLGAKVAGDFAVTPGQTLQIIVAGQGAGDAFSAAGGGATFVARGSNGFSIRSG